MAVVELPRAVHPTLFYQCKQFASRTAIVLPARCWFPANRIIVLANGHQVVVGIVKHGIEAHHNVGATLVALKQPGFLQVVGIVSGNNAAAIFPIGRHQAPRLLLFLHQVAPKVGVQRSAAWFPVAELPGVHQLRIQLGAAAVAKGGAQGINEATVYIQLLHLLYQVGVLIVIFVNAGAGLPAAGPGAAQHRIFNPILSSNG